MLVENALQVKLVADLTSLTASRVYYVKAPQDVTAPYLIIQKISQARDVVTTGKRYVQARMQISCFASTYASIKAIGALIQTSLDKFSGLMGGGLWVVNTTYDNETDLGYDDDLKLYGLAVDYMLLYELAITNT